MVFLQRFFGPRRDGKIDKLRDVPGLGSLGETELAQLADAGELALIPAGTVLLQETKRARWCYVVLAGSVTPRHESAASDGSRPTGEAVGEADTLTVETSAATVVATTDLVVLAIRSDDFRGLLDACAGFARTVDQSLAHANAALSEPSVSSRPVLRLLGGT